jgi:HEAT repeat protein
MQDTQIAVLIEKCASGDPQEQVSALQALVKMKANSAIPMILELLHSSDEDVRFCAAEALGDLGANEIESVGSALINLLTDSEYLVRSGATDSLGILGYKPARNLVESLLLNDPAPLVRASAAETLGDLGDTEALNSLKLAMQDSDTAVRSYAANSLGLLGTPELLPQLQTYLESEKSLSAKAEILGAKYRLGAKKDINSFLNLLENADQDLAMQMLNVLKDLIERKQPSALAEDAFRISEVLTRLSVRFTLLSSQVRGLIAQLKALE